MPSTRVPTRASAAPLKEFRPQPFREDPGDRFFLWSTGGQYRVIVLVVPPSPDTPLQAPLALPKGAIRHGAQGIQ